MSYLQKLSLVTLLAICSTTFAIAMDSDSDEDPFHPFSEVATSVNKNIKYTTNPDEIYKHILKQENVESTAVIIDVDGTITKEKDPSTLRKNQLVIPNGESVEYIRELINQGALVIFCSAWNRFNETMQRLRQVGFEEQDFTISNEANLLTNVAINIQTPNSQNVNLLCHQYGRIISVKQNVHNSQDPYFRNKALSLMLFPSDELESIGEIYFLDDNFKNHEVFFKDVNDFGLYQGKAIHQYLVTVPEEETPSSSS